MDTEERNSVEKGTHRSKAPAPVKVCFAGAEAIVKSVPPPSPRSSEDRLRPRAQLRPTFSRRRKTNTEEPNSVEKGAHRRKVTAPVRVCFAGAGAMCKCCLPVRGRSSEDRVGIRGQLRLGSGNRRTADCWNRNSVEKGAHRRMALAPVRGGLAGAGACVRCCSPVREC